MTKDEVDLLIADSCMCMDALCPPCNRVREALLASVVEPPAPQWDINSVERIARQQGVFGGREGDTVTITGPMVINGPSLNRRAE